MLRIVFHARSKIPRPLTRYVVRDEEAEECDAGESREYDIVHITVSVKNSGRPCERQQRSLIHTSRLSEGRLRRFSEPSHGEHIGRAQCQMRGNPLCCVSSLEGLHRVVSDMY